jgi:ABC-type branched-subunit amino acid transport system ATPase component
VALLQATEVSKEFGGVHALRQVNLELAPGEIQGLIGPNGSGKTTLVNVISGLIAPSVGSVEVDGLLITGWPANRVARAGVARTFQNVRLFGKLTVLENVEVGVTAPRSRRKSKDSRRVARNMLKELGITRYQGQLASELPYGLQRRVEIARALAARPSYLLLDEPAAGMNEVESDDLRSIIQQIPSSRSCGILVIDHDLRFITALCSRIHVLDAGRTIALDTPQQIQVNPAVIEAYLGGSAAKAEPAQGTDTPLS